MKVLLATVVALTIVILCGAADPECTKRKSTGQALHWAKPDDCSRFYRCSAKNVKREVICPPEKEYNAKTGKCSPKGKGSCKLRPIKPIAIEDLNEADTDIADEVDVNEANICNNVTSGKFLPKANFCRDFYICHNNISSQQTCDSDSYFDSANGNCVPDVNRTCWQNKCIDQKNGTYLPDTKSCLNFYICQNNETVLQNCDSGSYFNATSGNCVPDFNRTCWQNKCIDQKNGTFLPDTKSCLNFYICQNNETVLQNCDSGSYFNATSGNCVPDFNRTCWQNKCIGQKNGTYLSDAKSCLTFYECQNNETVLQNCNSGYYFNATSMNCMLDVNNTNCWENYCLTKNNGDLVTNNADCYKYYKCQDKHALAESCPEGSYFNKTILSCERGICPDEITTEKPTEPTTEPTTVEGCTCPGGYREGDIVQHPTSCILFYICYKSELLEQDCRSGNYFDAQLGACKRDMHGICADSKVRSIGPRSKRSAENINQIINENSLNKSVVVGAAELTTTEVAILPTTTEVPTGTPAPQKCLGIYEEGELVADPKNCQNFGLCFGGELIEQSCGLGNYFDAREKVCKHDGNSLCNPKLTTVNPNEAAIVKMAQAKNESCNCPGGYVGGDILPHPTDCDKFYVCFDSELQLSECGVGNLFDAATQACMPDVTATCWPNTTNPTLNCTCPGGYVQGQMVPYPDSCRLYYMCYDSKLVQSDCGDGNRFNSTQQACVSDTYDTCSPSSSNCNKQPNNVMLPNPAQCGSFYLCLNGNAIPENCDAADWFDPSVGSCVPDINATCRNPCNNTTGITLLPHPQCNKLYICNNGQSSVGICKPGEGFLPQMQACIQGGCSNNTKCYGKQDGTTFPVPNNTQSFYYCLNGVEMQRQCGNETMYNATIGICMLQPSTDCNQLLCTNATDGKISPTISGTENNFCECRHGSAFKHSCPTGYTFNSLLNICYSNAPCDPTACVNSEDFTPLVNRNDSQSFCLCVSNVPISVKCPNNSTFYPNLSICRQPVAQDPNCNPNVCLTAPQYKAFSSNSADTSSFCVCIDGGAELKKCLSSSVFSERNGICLSVEMECDATKCKSGTTTFFPAAGDRNAFCYCVDPGTVNLVKCPNGTHYDDTFKACLADPCDQSLCLDPSRAYTVYPSNTNPYIFCYCNGNQATWRACSNGTVFNDIAKACLPDVPDCDIKLCANATIGNAYAMPAKNDSNSFCYCTSPISVTKFSCAEGKLFDPTKAICVGDELCEGKYTQYQTIANPAACNKYFVCLNGNMLDLTCGDGLYYNNASNQCLPNNSGQCKITQDSNCTCPGGYKEGQFVPHPERCQKFYICDNSKLQEADCGDGNYFDEALSYCVRDTTGICTQNYTCTCVGNYREGDLVANPDDSQLYFICYNAHLQSGDCGTGNIFDPKLLHCVPGLPGVNQRTHAMTKRSTPDVLEQNCIEGVKRSVPTNCSQYETCFNGNWTRTICSEHLFYNPDKQLCLEPRDDTICAFARVAGLPSCKDENENHVMPSRNQQCGNYLRCSRGKWRLKNCPKQQFFSARLHTCIATENSAVCHEMETTIQPNVTAVEVTVKCEHTQVRYYQPNCATYYMCLQGEWWIQYCPLGMYFNRTQNYCVPNNSGQCKAAQLKPQSATADELSQTSCSKEGALRASPSAACEQYYVCVAGMWFRQTCGLRQYFNETQEACVAIDGTCVASNVSLCDAGSRRAVPLNCTAYMRCTDDGASWLHFDCSTNHYFDDVLKTCVPNDGSCASSGLRRACHVGDLKPHPDKRNCGEFLHCEAQVGWQIGTCLKDYIYEQTAQACLLGDRDANCTLSKPEKGNTTALPKKNPCIGKIDGVSVVHASDCNKFHICINGTKSKVQICPNGSFFDEALNYCRPNDGTCQLPLDGPCEGQLDGAFVANTQNCSSYYKCSKVNGTQMQQCALGKYFHNVTRQCRQDKGECVQLSVASICAGQQHGARLPHETYCNNYYVCVHGVAVQVECPNEHKFNRALHRCLPDIEHECQNGLLVDNNSTQSCTNKTDGVFVADKSDCTRYYICSSGEVLHKQCITGSYFDEAQLLCVPDNGSCPFVDNGQQIVPPDPIVCIGRHGELLPDQANCNQFYVCINGKLRLERCYEKHFFNVTTTQCQLRLNLTTNSTQMGPTKTIRPIQCPQQPTNITSFCAKLELGASLAEQGDCRRYIACNEGEVTFQRCRNGESFDSLLGVCRQNDGTCLLENGERVGDCNGKHGQIMRNTNNCRGYFVCINGQKINSECAKNEYFNKTLNLCQPDLLSQCNITENGPTNQTAVNILTTLKRFPEEKLCDNAVIGQRYVNIINRCRSFYICLGNDTVQHEHCPEGSLFHSATSKCEDAELVPCSKT